MNSVLDPVRLASPAALNPFDFNDEAAYQGWRSDKLARRARCVDDLIVDVADPKALSEREQRAMLQRCADWNMCVYRSPNVAPDKAVARAMGEQLGLRRLDANWLADADGISSITVGQDSDGRGGFIPYTNRPLKWHTDGYYHPPAHRIHATLLHCVRPARTGGVNALLDHELAYIALRDAAPRWAQALMADDAMTIPAREGGEGVARAAQAGPVFWVDPRGGALHMRYTARTRSIEWKPDTATLKAVAFLDRYLREDNPDVLRLRLEAGMGIVANNVLHDRSDFVDDATWPRLLFRARYLDRVASPESACRNG